MRERMSVLQFISLAKKGAGVRRYHTSTTIKTDTVGSHSFGVVILVFALTEMNPSQDLIKAALFHDLSEGELGDIPHPAKRKYEVLHGIIDTLEEKWNRENGFHVSLSKDEMNILKWADLLDCMIFCVEERELGSRIIENIFDTALAYVDKLSRTDRTDEIVAWILGRWADASSRGF